MLPDELSLWLTDSKKQSELPVLIGFVAIIALPLLLVFRQIRRQGPDPIGEAKREAHKGMLRAMLVVYAGLAITGATLAAASGSGGGTYVVAWGALLFGGLSLLGQLFSYYFRTKPRLDALAFVSAQSTTAPPLAWTPPRRGRGFWGWVRIVAIGVVVLGIGARAFSALSPDPQPSRVIGQATVPARAKTPTPTDVPRKTPTPMPTVISAASESTRVLTPRSTSTPSPTTQPITVPPGWDQVDNFGSSIGNLYRAGRDEFADRSFEDGQYTITIRKADAIAWDIFGASSGDDVKLRTTIASTDGDGDIVLLIASANNEPIWSFHVSPLSQQWSVARYSVQRDNFFNWVEPRSYAKLGLGPVKTVELWIVDGKPDLLINGQDVVGPTGVQLEKVPEDVHMGYGGWGAGFTIVFDEVAVGRPE